MTTNKEVAPAVTIPLRHIGYYSIATEYESGWGNRPDGVIIALDKDILLAKIAQVNSEQGQEFSRCEPPKLCIITDEMAIKIKNNKDYGFLWTKENSKNWLIEQ
jgi:hypothetical protein